MCLLTMAKSGTTQLAAELSPAGPKCRVGSRAIARMSTALRSNKRGAVLVEFGFVIIPFMALLMACLYTSLVFFSQQVLETAVQNAARRMAVGTSQKAATTQAAFKNEVCAELPTFMQCSRLYIDVRSATTFSGLNMTTTVPATDADGNVTGSGAYDAIPKNQIGMVRFAYIWPTGGGPLGLTLANSANGRRLLVATSVFQAEPY